MTDEPDPEEDAGEGRVLSPEELDIEEDEHVEHLDGDRYVVSADGPPDAGGDPAEPTTGSPAPDRDPAGPPPEPAAGGPDGGERPGATAGGPATDPEDAAAVLAGRLATADAEHGFDATVKLDGRVDRERLVSDDLVTTFESLATWYARRVDEGTPVEEVLGILLTEARAPVTVPTPVVADAVADAGLDEADSVGELLAVLEETGGLRLER